MPELDFAVLANAAQVGNDRLISLLGGGWDTATLSEDAFPVGLVLTVVFRLLLDQDELEGKFTGEVAVQREDGERLASVTFALEMHPTEEHDLPPGWKSSVPFVIPVPVQIPEPGIYAVVIALDGQALKTIPLRFKVAGA
jgi:hypothetical protein